MSKKIRLTTEQLLKSIVVHLSAYIGSFGYHADPSEQYTKAGPGRKHKQGKAKYIPRTEEFSAFRVDSVTGKKRW